MKLTKKDLITTLAFVLFLTGFTSLALSLVGIRWQFLAWIDRFSPLLGFLTKIGMILFSIILLVLVNTSEDDNTE
ncbi:MAG: hypothetical protein KDC53_04115 [Saprospiraceae bacterium]|nr:hypothetical protein [Saprospiraceae bacterium]